MARKRIFTTLRYIRFVIEESFQQIVAEPNCAHDRV